MMTPRKTEPRPYHHGDLRAALLRAATEELAENGVEGFTLRSCARRAGVSHAAPAHHFGDVTGLLTEVAIDAFHRLAGSINRQVAKAEAGTVEHPIAVALGYVLFAIQSPAEFTLMFRAQRLDTRRPEYRAAAGGAFAPTAGAVGAYFKSANPMGDPVMVRRVIGLWSLAQGVAGLLIAGQLGPPEQGEKIARALLPDLVRELFGTAARNDAKDLKFIARTSEAQRA
jgi:AcrR family transcriptional regulator